MEEIVREVWRCSVVQRGGGGRMGIPYYMWWIKIGKDSLGASNPSHRPDHIAQGCSTKKINPHNFWLQKSVGVGAAEKTAEFPGNCA